MPALLELDHVGLSYHTLAGEIPALSQISFSIQEGEFVSLVGPSGCGKSTVLNLIAGLLTPEQGQITLQGLPREHSVLSIGYMLQKDHLFEWLTIYENVLLGLEIQKKKSKKSGRTCGPSLTGVRSLELPFVSSFAAFRRDAAARCPDPYPRTGTFASASR